MVRAIPHSIHYSANLTATEVLGISSSASKSEIKKAYHKVCAPPPQFKTRD